MSGIGILKAAAIAAVVGCTGVAFAGATNGAFDPQELTLSAMAQADGQGSQHAYGADLPAGGVDSAHPMFLDEGPATSDLHGFVEYPFKTAYITPRGLVVENQGLVMQPVAGIAFRLGDLGPIKDVTVATGVWNSINLHQGDPYVGPWNELDYFVSVSGSVDKFTGTLTYSPWFSPPHAFHTEETSDFKLSYDDTGLILKDIGLHPYMDFFYSISGDSTVILGRPGGTYYFELGVQPSITYKGLGDAYPLTFAMPVYFSVGPKNYWNVNETGNHFGVFSAALNVSMPLTFIPTRLGHWHVDAGVQYFNLLNGTLVDAGTLSSGNTQRQVWNSSIGVGVNF